MDKYKQEKIITTGEKKKDYARPYTHTGISLQGDTCSHFILDRLYGPRLPE